MKAILEIEWADLAFNGLLYEPLVKDIQAFIDENQKPCGQSELPPEPC